MGLLIFIGIIIILHLLGSLLPSDMGIPSIVGGISLVFLVGAVIGFVIFIGAFMISLI